VFYEFLKCGLYNTYNTFCLIQWTNVRAHDRWAVSANCLRRFGPVRDIRFVKLVPHCVLLRTHDGRWCNGRWCRMVPTADWQFNAGCAGHSLQLAATSCSLQHAQLYSCTHGRVLYTILYIRIIQMFYTHSSIVTVCGSRKVSCDNHVWHRHHKSGSCMQNTEREPFLGSCTTLYTLPQTEAKLKQSFNNIT
jgi:hypothetical protein